MLNLDVNVIICYLLHLIPPHLAFFISSLHILPFASYPSKSCLLHLIPPHLALFIWSFHISSSLSYPSTSCLLHLIPPHLAFFILSPHISPSSSVSSPSGHLRSPGIIAEWLMFSFVIVNVVGQLISANDEAWFHALPLSCFALLDELDPSTPLQASECVHVLQPSWNYGCG